MALNLAAPHTWPAAIMPTLVATSFASKVAPISITLDLSLLVIVILMQSAANTLNDYFDFLKGTDTDSDNVDPTDAVLVYNNVKPRSALILAIAFLVVAFLLGIYVIAHAGWAPLVIAFLGVLCVVFYSAGKSPISYLPLGEIVSGFVMGALIPLAVYQSLTKEINFSVLIWAIPIIIGVALIMFTNNTCDIERDTKAKRKTLPMLLGRTKAVVVYRTAIIIWLISIITIVAVFFAQGILVMPFMVLALYPQINALFNNTFTPDRRLQAMPQILVANITFNAFYSSAIFAGSNLTFVA